MWKFIQFELKYWFKKPMVWIFFSINTLLVFFAVASEHVSIGGSFGNMHKNSPFLIEEYYMAFSTFCLLITTAFMNATANRDFQYGMHHFIFSSPIKKRDYFFGKFIGASIVSLFPFLGISVGVLLGAYLSPLMPSFFEMCPQERFGEIVLAGHFYGITNFALPNVIIGGVCIFSLAILFRSSIISFIGSTLILVFYVVSGNFTKDIQKEWLASLLDPFGLKPFDSLTKYFTVDEKNTIAISLQGDLLINRLVWLGIMMIILILVYHRFSFNVKNVVAKRVKTSKYEFIPILSNIKYTPTKEGIFSIATFWSLVIFEVKAIVKNPTFIILISIGMILLITTLTSFSSNFGAVQYPVTYHIVGMIEDSFMLFIIGFITFYTGVLVWKERDAKINEIQDATPIQTLTLFTSKLLALIISIALIFLATIIVGLIVQTINGYTRYELDVYFKSLLVLQLLHYSYLVVLSLLLHYLINNRYIAYFAFVTFLAVNSYSREVLEISSNMISFNAKPSIIYSDMNGFGPFVPSTIWFYLYWGLFCFVLCFVVMAFYIRGKELNFNLRLTNAWQSFKLNKLGLATSLCLFMLCGSFVFYNTKMLNKITTSKEIDEIRKEYELTYKKYENLPQPQYAELDYNIDIFPNERNLLAKIGTWANNNASDTIKELHFTMPLNCDSVSVSIAGAELKLNNPKLKYRIYRLINPLAPNDSIQIIFNISWVTKGFENEVSFKQLTNNGMFFHVNEILPTLGYTSQNEISDNDQRTKFNLPNRERKPSLDENNLLARNKNYLSGETDWIMATATLSTSKDQIAIAPGALIKSWEENGRNYFKYKLDQKSLNFYSFISADYQVARKKSKGVDLEVYYDQKHASNVPNMLKSMEKSLAYYSENFGPYYHKQCRIIETPRYHNFAQSFPGTMPYGEGQGFITDLRNVNKDGIDIVFDLVAHEMAHQYWAHQVCGANMQGSEMLSESFAQYSALMVMEKEYGKEKIHKLLKYEMNRYLSERTRESRGENPLMKTVDQPYIHYNKASVVLYFFKEMVGEQKVNLALKSLINKFGYKNPPYPTSIDAINEFKKITPDSLSYLIPDLFENITLFSNRVMGVTSKKHGNQYEVTIQTSSEKFRSNALGKESLIPIADYIDLAVFGESNSSDEPKKVLVYKRLKITKKDNTFIFHTKEKPFEVGIDPYNYLIDKISDDNLKIVE